MTVFLIILWGCEEFRDQSIKVGLAVDLSGPGGITGEYIRNGVMLAIREINDSGGINGRRLKLIIKDDGGTPQGALAADEQLVAQGVVAVLGHSTSTPTVAAHAFLSSKGILQLTAYASTSELSGRDDLFFRTCVDTRLYARGISRYLEERNYKQVVALLDLRNTAYSMDLFRHLVMLFSGKLDYVSYRGNVVRSEEVVKRILSYRPQVVLLLTDTYTTALFVQKLRARGFRGDFVATIWAQSPELKEFGGQAAEGLRLITYVACQQQTEAYLELKKRVSEHLHHPLTAWTATGYELVEILAQALRTCPEPEASCLKEALLKQTFRTVLGEVHFDPYGDVIRPLYLVELKDGHFVDLGVIKP
ncbi:ABC transporter substrate-binding protein [Thermosulfuriphilus sp.]